MPHRTCWSRGMSLMKESPLLLMIWKKQMLSFCPRELTNWGAYQCQHQHCDALDRIKHHLQRIWVLPWYWSQTAGVGKRSGWKVVEVLTGNLLRLQFLGYWRLYLLAEGWLDLAGMQACKVYWNPMWNPWAIPAMIHYANCWSGWCCRHMRQASRFSGVTICAKCSGRGGGEGFTEACKISDRLCIGRMNLL